MSLAWSDRFGGRFLLPHSKEQFGASPDFKRVMMESVANALVNYQESAKQVLNSQRVQDGSSDFLLEPVYVGFAIKRADGAATL